MKDAIHGFTVRSTQFRKYFIPNIQQHGHLILYQLSTHVLNLSTLTSRKKRCQKWPVHSLRLLKFGTYNQRHRNAIARLAKWLSSDKPPWPAYRAFMAGRLIALDNVQEFVPLSGKKYCHDSSLNVYSVWPKSKRREIAEWINSAEDCKQA